MLRHLLPRWLLLVPLSPPLLAIDAHVHDPACMQCIDTLTHATATAIASARVRRGCRQDHEADLAGPSEFPPPSLLPFRTLAGRAAVSRTSLLKQEHTADAPLQVVRVSVFALSITAAQPRPPAFPNRHVALALRAPDFTPRELVPAQKPPFLRRVPRHRLFVNDLVAAEASSRFSSALSPIKHISNLPPTHETVLDGFKLSSSASNDHPTKSWARSTTTSPLATSFSAYFRQLRRARQSCFASSGRSAFAAPLLRRRPQEALSASQHRSRRALMRSRSRRATARSPRPISGSVPETHSAASRQSRTSSTSRQSSFP